MSILVLPVAILAILGIGYPAIYIGVVRLLGDKRPIEKILEEM